LKKKQVRKDFLTGKISAIREHLEKVGPIAEKDAIKLAEIITKREGDFERYDKDRRARIMLTMIASVSADSPELFNSLISAIPLIIEGGKMSLAIDQLQQNQQQLDLAERQENRLARKDQMAAIKDLTQFSTAHKDFQSRLGTDWLGASPGSLEWKGAAKAFQSEMSRLGKAWDTGAWQTSPNFQADYFDLLTTAEQIGKEYSLMASKPKWWQRAITFFFAKGAPRREFDLSPNMVALDQNGAPVTEWADFHRVRRFDMVDEAGNIEGRPFAAWFSAYATETQMGQAFLKSLFFSSLQNNQELADKMARP